MSENKNKIQNFETIKTSNLLHRVRNLKEDGYRFVQACGITGQNGASTVMYSFCKDYVLTNVKIVVEDGEEVESITKEYWNAFIYENEVHDLFGVKFAHSALDYGGNFFRVSEETPWKSKPSSESAEDKGEVEK